MHFAFVSCLALTTLDLRGFDPSHQTDLVYTFAGCSALATIYADAGFTLPSGAAGSYGTFNSCSALVGGAGTAYSSSMTKEMYMRIDGGTTSPGHLSTQLGLSFSQPPKCDRKCNRTGMGGGLGSRRVQW